MRFGLAIAAAMFASALDAQSCLASHGKIENHSVRAEVFDSKGAPLPFAFLELRPRITGEVGARAGTDSAGGVSIPSIQPGCYELSVEAGGFMILARTITIDGDKDLGRIVMDADPNVMWGSSGAIVGNPPEPALDIPPVPVPFNTPPLIRGQIQSASLAGRRRLTAQLSCSEQLPQKPERPQWEVARLPVDDTGRFEGPVPPCPGEMLAHWELRFSLKDEHGATIALLLPGAGIDQSKIGVWLPLTMPFEPAPVRDVTFFPEFTDNRPLQATLSLSPPGRAFHVGQMVLLNLILTNTSDEVIDVSSSIEDINWIISDDHDQRVAYRLFRDRTANPSRGNQTLRSVLLFPGESQTAGINVSLKFDLTAPGTYHAVARRDVRRFEIPGEEQITSAATAFVILP